MESSQSSSLPSAEARHATIVKCDLVGSTRARKTLDLEGQLQFQRRFEETVIEVVERHGAHLAGFEGDGALIAFGLPEPREDDAERAIRMGLDLIAAVHDAELVPNRRSQVRVGIASGLVALVKRRATAHSEYFAGTTIDLAERLRVRAGPDELVVADETKRLAGGYFVYDDLGPVECKGFDEPVLAWRVVGPAQRLSRFEAQRFDPGRGEIVGREAPLAQLADAWAFAQRGRGRLILLRGEAGIGKSRLARQAIDQAKKDRATVMRIDCAPSAGNTPLFPVGVLAHEAAGVALRASPEEKRAAIERMLSARFGAEEAASAMIHVAPMLGLGEAPPGVSPDAFRAQTIEAFAHIFDLLTAQGPLLFVCEDLHWADDSTASLMARFNVAARERRALVIVTTRPVADLSAFDLATLTTLDLSPLDASASADLVRSVAKGEPLAEAVVNRIVERCEGLPLILEEVTRNALEASSRAETLAPMASRIREVPAALQIIVQSRLNRHSRLAPLVQSAAVLGREFPKGLLRRLALIDGGGRDLPAAIETLRQEGLFAAQDDLSPEQVRFRHGMISDAVYNTLLGSDRRRIHSAAADILIGDFAGTPYAAPDIVAQHLSRAGRYVEAIRTRLAASQSTAARGAYVETEGHCQAALSLVDEVADPQQRAALQFRLLVQLGVAATGRLGYGAAEAEDAYRRAYAVCGDHADAEMLYPIMRGLSAVNFMRGELAAAHELAVQGHELAERSRRPEFRIDALTMRSYATMYFGRLADCRKEIDECLELYRSIGGERLTYPAPHDAATSVMAIRPTILWLMGDDAEAEAAVEAGVAHVERLGRDYDIAMVHAWVAGYRVTRRQWAEAIRHAALAISISERNGYAEFYGTGVMLTLLSQCAMGSNPQALAQAVATLGEFRRRGVRLNASYFLLGIARGHVQADDFEAARRAIADARDAAAASSETRMNAELAILEAEIEPDDAEAARLLREAMAKAERDGAVATALRAAALLAQREGADEIARANAEAALAVFDRGAPSPAERDWMKRSFAVLNERLAAPAQSAAPAA